MKFFKKKTVTVAPKSPRIWTWVKKKLGIGVRRFPARLKSFTKDTTVTIIYNPDNLSSLRAAATCKELYDSLESENQFPRLQLKSIRDTYEDKVSDMYIWFGMEKNVSVVQPHIREAFKKAAHYCATIETYIDVPTDSHFMHRLLEALFELGQTRATKPQSEFEQEFKIECGEFIHYVALYMYCMPGNIDHTLFGQYSGNAGLTTNHGVEDLIDKLLSRQRDISRFYYKKTNVAPKEKATVSKDKTEQYFQKDHQAEINRVITDTVNDMKSLGLQIPEAFSSITPGNIQEVVRKFNESITRSSSVAVCTNPSGTESAHAVVTRIESMYWLALRSIRMSRKYYCNYVTTRTGTMSTSNVPSYMTMQFSNGHISS